jgi:hypothetical protein
MLAGDRRQLPDSTEFFLEDIYGWGRWCGKLGGGRGLREK